MIENRHIFLFVLLLAVVPLSFAQYPNYFTYDNENGLPSNEVYSIAQDKRGFIWIGCDAGLYKFDGVRYTLYKRATQKSRTVSGLIFSASGRLYCYNFQSQLFYLENDTLKELAFPYANINNLASDFSGNLIVNHQDGLAVYNEPSGQWKNYNHFGVETPLGYKNLTKSAKTNAKGEVCFLSSAGVGIYANETVRFLPTDLFQKEPAGNFLTEWINGEPWIFGISKIAIFRYKNGIFQPIENQKLLSALQGRKLTNVKTLADGNVWLCTYNGLICYNPKNDSVSLLYPQFAFSDVLIDREGNYWFSTLQSGILRVADMRFSVWNNFENSKLNRLTTDGLNVYFAATNSFIGKLNTQNGLLQTFRTERDADIQCLNYEASSQTLYFFANPNLYKLKEDKISSLSLYAVPPVKCVRKVANSYLLCSSFGTFIYDFKTKKQTAQLSSAWSRQAEYDAKHNFVWIATNTGLLQFVPENGNWRLRDSLLHDTQVLSIDFDTVSQMLFALTFDGKIVSVSTQNEVKPLVTFPAETQAYRLREYSGELYITSNNGLWRLNLQDKRLISLNQLSGLASDNVMDVEVVGENAWIATSKGLQKIPLGEMQETPLAKIYLKREVNPQLEYGEPFTLSPEVSAYSSHGKFQYAYRIKNRDTAWSKLPATVEQIEVQNIPSGYFTLELKAIDHLGRDSENVITISGYVHPPFWERWWFIAGVMLLFFALIYWAFSRELRKRQKQLQLQNELNISKLTAIKSQMNPHFIFNSLNSIQDLVLKGDTENSYSYLTTFSNMVRQTLNFSDKDFIDFDEELRLIEIYLSLEKLRFKKDFEYTIDRNGVDDISIPPLLIQPFIENALVHGLLHKEGEKRLSIRFELQENLRCEITDNGIGRERSKQIRQRQRMEHQSFSGEAIKKRFEILSEVFQGVFNYEYHDLPNGTHVVLTIPVKRKF